MTRMSPSQAASSSPLRMAAQDRAVACGFYRIDLGRQPREPPEPRLEEPVDLGCGQGGNGMEARLRQCRDLAAFDHAPITPRTSPVRPHIAGPLCRFAELTWPDRGDSPSRPLWIRMPPPRHT